MAEVQHARCDRMRWIDIVDSFDGNKDKNSSVWEEGWDGKWEGL